MIPYRNATLTSIAGGGTIEDFDTPAGSDTPRWQGSLGIYVADEVSEERVARSVRQASGGRVVDELVSTRLEIPYDIGRLAQRGDTMTYSFEGSTHQRAVRDIIRSEAVGRVRVLLVDA